LEDTYFDLLIGAYRDFNTFSIATATKCERLCYIALMSLDLKGRTALVTGAGRGIGRAIAQKLAESGANVMLNDLDRDPVFETGMLIDKAGGHAKALPGDITAAGFPEKLVNAAVTGFGGLDIVVNNAGYTWDSVIQKTTDEQFQAMLDIHMVAPFRILRAASEYIRTAAKKETAEGRRVMRKVVNITSISGTDGIAGQSGYGSGKAGIVGLTKVLAKEWGRYNVNVNAVGFGFIETRLVQPLGPESEIDVKGRKIKVGVQPAAIDAMKQHCPLGRLGTPDEAAGPVLFFCSPLSDYVSGEVLICSGGARM
jgi:3-oxoacyl-[acyl-carrier protein] reductase